MSESAFSCASTWPAFTSSPDLKLTLRTRPATSVVTSTLRTAAQRSHRIQLGLPELIVGLQLAADRRWRQSALAHVLRHHVALEEVVSHQAANEQSDWRSA